MIMTKTGLDNFRLEVLKTRIALLVHSHDMPSFCSPVTYEKVGIYIVVLFAYLLHHHPYLLHFSLYFLS